jgi:hypothetical protein
VRASLFPSIADALKALGRGSAWIDWEIAVEDASGLSSFNDLQADLNTGRPDMLWARPPEDMSRQSLSLPAAPNAISRQQERTDPSGHRPCRRGVTSR